MEQHPAGVHEGRGRSTAGTGNTHTADGPLELGAALAIVENAERTARRQLNGNASLVYLLWGLAWMTGYGALDGSRRGWLPLEPTSALAVLGAALLVATIATMVLSVRATLGIRGHSSFQSGMYSASWQCILGLWLLGVTAAALLAGPDHFLAVYLYWGSGGMLAGSAAEYLATRKRGIGVRRA